MQWTREGAEDKVKKVIQSEQGFSLLELLVSLVIFSIVITAFMGFFYQSSIFTKKNEDDLIAINLAREVLEIIKENEPEDGEVPTFPTVNYQGCSSSYDPSSIGAKDILNLNADGTFQGNGSLYPCFSFKDEIVNDEAGYKTFLVTIEIYKKGQTTNENQLLTKTYGYVREYQ